jgi:hypothetical protein
MSSGYTKLFSSITDSTIWQEPSDIRIVWITMLAMADQHGYVGASVPGLAARAKVSMEACIKAIEKLHEPDEWSRTKEFEGRRIATVDGGWVLLNHEKYRAIRDADERREQARLAMAKMRAKKKGVLTDVINVIHGEPPLAQAEASTEAEANKKTKALGPSGRFVEFWTAYPKRRREKKAEAFKIWNQRKFDLVSDLIMADVNWRKAKDPDWLKDGGQFVPQPPAYLRGERWADGAAENLSSSSYGIGASPAKVDTPQSRQAERVEGLRGLAKLGNEQAMIELINLGVSP